jgi:Competence protein CoiA-like family
VLLLWAKDRGGRKVRADRLVAKDRRGRGPFACLGCGEALVPHLGRIRAPHFAHLPGSQCPLTAPETALHLDAKERLLALCAEAFAGTRRVAVVARCPACRRALPLDVAALGDAAEPEGAVGPLRADVLVRTRGRPALAVEVKVTHAVDPEKEAALAAAGVPFVEVDAREDWERPAAEGTEIACARSGGVGPCGACLALSRADAERAKGGEAGEIAELEAYRARGLFGAVSAGPGRWPPSIPAFRCPDCGGRELQIGEALARHACPGRAPSPAPLRGAVEVRGQASRPVAWRGYSGEIVTLSWWRRGGGAPGGPKRPE